MADKNLPTIIEGTASQLAGLTVGSSSNWAYNPKEDVEELRRMVLSIQATLDDAEEKDVKDEAVQLWLEELKDLAYDAEDIVVECDYEVLRSKIEGQNKIGSTHKPKREEEVCNLITSTVSLPSDFGDSIKKIREKFDEITRDRNILHLPRKEDREEVFDEITPFVHESAIYGREQDKAKVIEWLLARDGSSMQSVSVLPIIGMGGIGKTTLAQLVYNDSKVCKCFSQRGWVHVSESFDVRRLLKEIYESLTKRSCNRMNMDVLCDNLKRQLNGERFLLILDDGWSKRHDLWESVKAPLIGMGIGKIIVTTRHASVARIMQTTPPYHLSCLQENQCWSLFWNHAFEGREPDDYENMEEVGKEIVRMCKGLPLAVKTLGGLLRFETNEERWTDILRSDLLELDEQKDDILPALKLSYIRMPTHLQRCFMYCSLFPKNFMLEKNDVIWLWMSQGLIQSKGGRQLEDIGNAYFEELIWRSFFQKKKMVWGELYVMHDLLHDLAEYVARTEFYKTEGCLSCNFPRRIRHLSFFSSLSVDLNLPEKFRDLRTLLLCPPQPGRIVSVEIQMDSFQKFTCLRTLDLRCAHITELPDSVGSLKQLRYLCVKDSKISRIPDSVCGLYNLLVLNLYKSGIKELPKDIKNLINLRHLLIGGELSISLPLGIKQITSLQTLSGFKVGIAGQHCGIGELKDLVHLRWRLVIDGLENVASLEDAMEAKMDNKGHLETLIFRFGDGEEVANMQGLAYGEFVKQMLENLRPHTNLKALHIRLYRGSISPSWLVDPNYSNLVQVELSDFSPSFAFLPSLGQLPSLKNLFIGRMSGVRSIGPEFCVGDFATTIAFPSLESLQFHNMPEWAEWHGIEDGDFPCLRILEIRWCQKLMSIPARSLPSLKELVIIDCEELGALPALMSLATLSLGSQRLCTSIYFLNLPSLQELTVCSRITESISLLHESFPLLKNLSFITCRNLGSIQGLQSLASLENLCIASCPKLRFSVDDRLPPMLQQVDVRSCPGLREWCQIQGVHYK